MKAGDRITGTVYGDTMSGTIIRVDGSLVLVQFDDFRDGVHYMNPDECIADREVFDVLVEDGIQNILEGCEPYLRGHAADDILGAILGEVDGGTYQPRGISPSWAGQAWFELAIRDLINERFDEITMRGLLHRAILSDRYEDLTLKSDLLQVDAELWRWAEMQSCWFTERHDAFLAGFFGLAAWYTHDRPPAGIDWDEYYIAGCNTAIRLDGRPLSRVFDDLVEAATVEDSVEMGNDGPEDIA